MTRRFICERITVSPLIDRKSPPHTFLSFLSVWLVRVSDIAIIITHRAITHTRAHTHRAWILKCHLRPLAASMWIVSNWSQIWQIEQHEFLVRTQLDVFERVTFMFYQQGGFKSLFSSRTFIMITVRRGSRTAVVAACFKDTSKLNSSDVTVAQTALSTLNTYNTFSVQYF